MYLNPIGKGKGRKGGNPDIVEISKKLSTGPKTDLGKLKGIVARSTHIQLTDKSKLLQKFRKCTKCPMGPREKEVVNKLGLIQLIKIPAICQFWKEDFEGCNLSIKSQVDGLRTFFALENNADNKIEQLVMDRIMKSALIDAETTAPVEIMKKGHTAGYTNMHRETAMKAAEIAHKLKYGEKNTNLNLNVDVSQQIINAYKDADDEDE